MNTTMKEMRTLSYFDFHMAVGRIHSVSRSNQETNDHKKCVLTLGVDYRKLGKTVFINELALEHMALGYKVLVIGHQPSKYFCDKCEYRLTHKNDFESFLRGKSKNEWIILIDDMEVERKEEIESENSIFNGFSVYGFYYES